MKTDIVIFGASVTQQKNGYAVELSKQLKPLKTKVIGFGGTHLNDAGICCIEQVLKLKPKICFLDWFTTSFVNTDEMTIKCLDAIIFQLVENKIYPVFLFLPHQFHAERKDFYEFCRSYLKTKKLIYIDITEKLNNTKNILRDVVHTNTNGSIIYANTIFKEYLKLKDSLLLNNINIPLQNSYTKIQHLTINNYVTDNIRFSLKGELIGVSSIIGPHSGQVQIINSSDNYYLNLRDRWCHYNRVHFILTHILNKGLITFYTSKTNHIGSSALIFQRLYFVGECQKLREPLVKELIKSVEYYWFLSKFYFQKVKRFIVCHLQ